MINYFWIIDDILNKRPEKYTIIMHANATNILQMIHVYLKDKCSCEVSIEEYNRCFETDTIINLEMKWL